MKGERTSEASVMARRIILLCLIILNSLLAGFNIAKIGSGQDVKLTLALVIGLLVAVAINSAQLLSLNSDPPPREIAPPLESIDFSAATYQPPRLFDK